ncbi:MAG: UDP-N-acetylmuramoyl-tripeptide--D-alanyl-D-alanine ligase [Adlercreutzia sp.]|nr:UDP-N-acetylmuramoyl-tripeptide--D-alanyl-D-alanine ligase [Adlercreutzia sp.]
MRLNAKQIAAYTGGQFLVDPIDPSALMTGITWDSREVQPGWLYVALPGERVDGHSFVEAALRAGARGALVMQPPAPSALLLAREMGAAVIEVANTTSAITDLARAWRGHLHGRVIALTGSVGKTTTKNLMRDVCAAAGSVVATKANQNNELGVPRTLLAADPETATVVVEMGMRGRGQIAELTEFVRPEWGLITNVGESHIELLGSRENIARAKAELLAALPAGTGQAFLNGADDFSAFCADDARLSARSVALTVFDGSPDAADHFAALEEAGATVARRLWAEDVVLDEEGRPRFTLCAAGFTDDGVVERTPCALALQGAHNVANACGAAAVGRALGLELAAVAEALHGSVPESGRQEMLTARGGFTVINDAYNASPDSMRASLATFAALAVTGRRIAVLGDMGELGHFAPACHRGVGEAAAGASLDQLVCVGDLAALIAEGAQEAGMDPSRIVRARTVADVLEELDGRLEPGDAVMVKASHFMELNRVVEGLVS